MHEKKTKKLRIVEVMTCGTHREDEKCVESDALNTSVDCV